MKYLALAAISLLLACHTTQKVYEAPAVGAEAQFDRGLRPEKHPRYLFDKKTMKDMQKNGSITTYTKTRHNTAPTIPLPKKNNDSKAAPADSVHTRIDSTQSPALPPDSTHIPQ